MWQSIVSTTVGLTLGASYAVFFLLLVSLSPCGLLVYFAAMFLSTAYRASLSKIKRFLADLGAR